MHIKCMLWFESCLLSQISLFAEWPRQQQIPISRLSHSPSSGPLCTSQFEGSGSRLISLFLAASASSLLAMMSRAESSGPQRSPRRSERAPRGQRAVAAMQPPPSSNASMPGQGKALQALLRLAAPVASSKVCLPPQASLSHS
jgi:hypothetical protein